MSDAHPDTWRYRSGLRFGLLLWTLLRPFGQPDETTLSLSLSRKKKLCHWKKVLSAAVVWQIQAGKSASARICYLVIWHDAQQQVVLPCQQKGLVKLFFAYDWLAVFA